MKKKFLSIFMSFALVASLSGLFSAVNFAFASPAVFVTICGQTLLLNSSDSIDKTNLPAYPGGSAITGDYSYDNVSNTLTFYNMDLYNNGLYEGPAIKINSGFVEELTIVFDGSSYIKPFDGYKNAIESNIDVKFSASNGGGLAVEGGNSAVFTNDGKNMTFNGGIYTFQNIDYSAIQCGGCLTVNSGDFTIKAKNIIRSQDSYATASVKIFGGKFDLTYATLDGVNGGIFGSTIEMSNLNNFEELELKTVCAYPSSNALVPGPDTSNPDIDKLSIDSNLKVVSGYDAFSAIEKPYAIEDEYVKITPKVLPHAVNTSANPAEGGTVTADKAEVFAEETVTLSTSPNEGFVLSTLDVMDESGSKIESSFGELVGDHTFSMPDTDVEAVGNLVTENYEISDGALSTYNGVDMVFRL
ncbi:MAG: hypothetical protein MJ060_04250, partial [Clostridia bacterium]|nr:hypothetical protein [Clostridia bacterium]